MVHFLLFFTFFKMLTREAKMIAANTQTGKGWNKGPRASITTSRQRADTRLVNILLNKQKFENQLKIIKRA